MNTEDKDINMTLEELKTNGWYTRLEDEKSELSDKQRGLSNYITCNEAFQQLSKESKTLLVTQNSIMLQYLSVLDKRIKLIHKEQGL